MTQSLIFNHHSLPLTNNQNSDEFIYNFIKLCVKLSNVGLNTILLDETVDKDWFKLKITDNYFWRDWYNKNKGNNNYKDIRPLA